ncbi:MAG TPA: pilin [bacterium]|nr:pilin [bacterium]
MKKAKNIFLIFLLSLSFVFSFNFKPALAQNSYWDTQVGMGEIGTSFGEDPGNVQDIRYRIVKIINIVLTVLGLIVVVLIIFAGFKWMTAAGNEDAVKDAQKIIKNAVIGLVIILLAWSITLFIMRRLAAVSSGDPNYITPYDSYHMELD